MKKKENKTYKMPKFIKNLPLPPSAREVYALLFSFSRAGLLYFGTVDYLARATGISKRSTERALKTLRDSGMIKKCREDGRVGYVTEKTEDERIPDEKETATAMTPVKAGGKEGALHRLAKLTMHTVPNEYGTVDYLCLRDLYPEPENSYVYVGEWGVVCMTDEQLYQLCKLAEPHRLKYYIAQLEKIVLYSGAQKQPLPRNHYKIIKRWIEEDTAL